jgi:hypothetical protein
MSEPTLVSTDASNQNGLDEHQILCALLHQLETADHLSLDEIDAVIHQADAAYKRHSARLDRTQKMIAQLGAVEEKR